VAAVTEQEVMTLPVGRELDAAVAEHVMGYAGRIIWYGQGMPSATPMIDGAFPSRVPDYSTDDTLAMSVLCKVRGEPPAYFVLAPRREGSGYLCHLEIDNGYVGFGATLSEAICRCCLLLTVTRKKQKEAATCHN
jgi:hypothetical protein